MKNKYKIIALILLILNIILISNIKLSGFIYFSVINHEKNMKYKSSLYPVRNKIYDNHYIKGTLNGKYQLINEKGEQLIPGTYDNIKYDGSEWLLLSGKKCKIYDKELKLIASFRSDSIPMRISSDIFMTRIKDKHFVVNKKDEKVITQRYDEIEVFEYTTPIVFKIKRKNKYGLVNLENEIILPVKYDEITQNNKYIYDAKQLLFWVQKNNKWALVDTKNNFIYDFIFDEIPLRIDEDYIISKVRVASDKKDYEVMRDIIEDSTKMSSYKRQLKKLEKLEKAHKVEGDLYVVSVYQGIYENKADARNHGNGKKGEVTVDVVVKNEPVTLYLTSYEAVNWKINTALGVKLKKVYLSGYYEGSVEFVNKPVPVEKLRAKHMSDLPLFDIKDYFDKYPKTFQYKYDAGHFVVDGINGTLQKELALHHSLAGPVRFTCNYKNCNISDYGLLLKHADTQNSSFYSATKYYTNGKYYFEAQFKSNEEEKNDKNILRHNNIGLISPNKQYLCIFYSNQRDDCMHYEIPDGTSVQLSNGDTVGYAVDFDKGNVYISINGNWIIGNPEQNESVYKLDKEYYRDYTVMASVDKGVSWKVNFGASPFKYKIPDGFKPYDGQDQVNSKFYE